MFEDKIEQKQFSENNHFCFFWKINIKLIRLMEKVINKSTMDYIVKINLFLRRCCMFRQISIFISIFLFQLYLYDFLQKDLLENMTSL